MQTFCFLVPRRLGTFCYQVLDGSSDALLQVIYGFAIFSGVNCVLEKVEGTFKYFYNVQWNFVGHDDYTAFNSF